jgi:hypothetical protein
MRCPVVYSATELNQWHLSEEYAPGKWRPSRCCGFWDSRNIKQQLRCAWMVLIGRYDAVNWGDSSGERKFRFKDCTDPEFFSASRVYHPPNSFGLHSCGAWHNEGECPAGADKPSGDM